jgi:hypothetical protein
MSDILTCFDTVSYVRTPPIPYCVHKKSNAPYRSFSEESPGPSGGCWYRTGAMGS